MTIAGSPALGAYGLRVTGIGAGAAWLGTVPDRFPPLHLVYRGEAADSTRRRWMTSGRSSPSATGGG